MCVQTRAFVVAAKPEINPFPSLRLADMLAELARTRELRSLSLMEAAPTPNPNPAGTGGSRPARRLPVAPDSEAAAARDPNKSPRPIYYRRYAGRRFPGKMPLSHT